MDKIVPKVKVIVDDHVGKVRTEMDRKLTGLKSTLRAEIQRVKSDHVQRDINRDLNTNVTDTKILNIVIKNLGAENNTRKW